MLDIGFSEILLLAIVALVVLGPEKLPHAARMAGAWVGRIRRMLISVQADIENEVAASEMRERIRKEMAKAKAESGISDVVEAVRETIAETRVHMQPLAPQSAEPPQSVEAQQPVSAVEAGNSSDDSTHTSQAHDEAAATHQDPAPKP